MAKKLRQLLSYYEELINQEYSAEEAAIYRERLLVQIQFFQHERLIHLMVTVLFALLAVLTLFVSLLIDNILLLVLFLLLFVLLVPYIRHYYILENGVQKLYEYYDRLEDEIKKAV